MRPLRLGGRLLLLLPALTAAFAAAQAPTALAATLTITARRLTADAATGIVVAEGNVRITDGRIVAVGARLVVDPRRRSATLTPGRVRAPQGVLEASSLTLRYDTSGVKEVTALGGATIELRQGVLTADQIVAVPPHRLTAAGRVRLSTPPDVVATGSRLAYDRRTGSVSLAGPVKLQSGQGVVTGRRLDAREDLQHAVLRGDVRAEFKDIIATAESATMMASQKKVVLSGQVRIRQGRRELRGARVTIFYESGRVISEGPTRMRIEEQPVERAP